MKDEYCIIYHAKVSTSKDLNLYCKLVNPKEDYILKMDEVSNKLIIKPLTLDYRGKTYKFGKDGNRFKLGCNLNLPEGRFYVSEDSTEDEIIIDFSEIYLED